MCRQRKGIESQAVEAGRRPSALTKESFAGAVRTNRSCHAGTSESVLGVRSRTILKNRRYTRELSTFSKRKAFLSTLLVERSTDGERVRVLQ